MQDVYTTLAFLVILLGPCVLAFRSMRKSE